MSLAGSNRKPALTAAASKIGFSRVTADKLKDEPWQDRAWGVYADLPEIFYMTRYRKDVAAQVEYFVATVDEPGADPNLDEGGRGAKVLQGEGGPELLRRIVSELVVHWDVPGEAHLVRFEEAPFWRVLSTQELKREGQSKTFLWGDETNQMGTIDRDNVYRVWDPHPRYHWQADSPVRHVLDNAEELILLTREAKARSLSRINAGTFWIPDGVDMSPFADDEEGTPDDFARELTNYMTRPLKDVGSASSLVPWIITANRDDIAAVRHITFERDWDINLELRRDLLRSVATGLDLPPEILTGMADLNHWSAWLVSEQAVSQHVLPTVDAILDSLTSNWFRPLLEASGLDPDLYVLWRDPSPATVPPDQSDVAIRLNELGVISDEATRRVTNFDDEDAPTPEELEAKAARKATTVEDMPTDGPPDPIRAAVDPDFVQQVAEAIRRLQEGDPPLGRAAVTAAVRRRIVATELADIDAELLTWCQEKADAEIERILGIVGKSLTAATDPLDESLLTRLASQLDAKIAEAQAAARGWVESLTAKPIDPEPESAFRSQGIQVIIGGILEAVRRRLFTPGPTADPIDTGRIPTVTTPTAAIRNGLSLAGGGPAVYEDGKTSELVGNGQHIHDELEDEGFFQDGYEWKYGHPANTFEPHLHLDGKQFTSWDDPQLAVNFGDSWLRRSHYAPGDHKGCCCAFIQVIIKQNADPSISVGDRPDEAVPNGPPLSWEELGFKLPKDPAQRKLMTDALQRLNGLDPAVRTRYLELLRQMDNVTVDIATGWTEFIDALGSVEFIPNPAGGVLQTGRRLTLHLSRQATDWDDWSVGYNAEGKRLFRESGSLTNPDGTPMNLKQKQAFLDQELDAWKQANPEPDKWRMATPDELADVLIHEIGHANDSQQFFETGEKIVDRLTPEIKEKVWELYWGGPRSAANPLNHPVYEYATEGGPGEMVAELHRFYLRGVYGGDINLTAVEWRGANPELANWVRENLLP